MLYIKGGTFIYIYLTFPTARTLAASMQCWRMVRALWSHGRCWLVSCDEMSPCASRSRTSSVTDRTTRKIFASSVKRTLLWSRWQQKRLDPSNGRVRRQPCTFDGRRKDLSGRQSLTPRYNRFIYFLL